MGLIATFFQHGTQHNDMMHINTQHSELNCDTQDNNTQHDNTQHNGTTFDTQHTGLGK